jgi:hypothetical protein
MEKPTLSEAATAVFEVLEPFDEGERLRIVTSAMALFGQELANVHRPAKPHDHNDDHDGGSSGVNGAKSRRWMTQNGITSDMVEQCFHLESETPEVVADIPGRSAREKTVNCYLLTGIASFLKNDEPAFADAAARALCEHAGCYDATNHNKYVKFGNRAIGDKKRGWKLLAPGLKEGALLLKQIATGASE